MCRPGRRRLALRGAPGGGKTFITRHTMAEWARRAAARIDKREAGLDEVDAPIWVTAKTLAQTGGNDLTEALLGALRNSLPPLEPSPRVEEWYRRAIGTSRASIVVDALDELQPGDRAAFEARARQLDGLPGLVVVTCRTMHWEDRRGWLGWSNLVEVELAPLKRRQQREFVRKFLTASPGLSMRMERLLNVNFALRHACTTPLLFTFACLLHEVGLVRADTTHAQLYAHLLQGMLSGEWRGVTPSWAGRTRLAQDCRQFLEGIAWGLFQSAPHLNRFTLDGWKAAARGAIRGAEGLPIDPGPFLDELEKVGMLVPAGFDDVGDQCWSLAHRTFLEFLAARPLSRMPQQVWLTEAVQHFWFQPEWLEVLTFLAGLVDDATPLIRAVEEEQKKDEDLFGSMLSLKARLVGAARLVRDEELRRACKEAITTWEGTLRGWREGLHRFSTPRLAALAASSRARDILVDAVLARLGDKDALVRQAAARALGAIGAERATERLLELLGDPNSDVRQAAAQALGAIGAERAVEPLVARLGDEDALVRWAAAEALGALGAARAVEPLVARLRDEALGVVWGAARALGALGAARAVEPLLARLGDEDPIVHWAAMGDPGPLEDFVEEGDPDRGPSGAPVGSRVR